MITHIALLLLQWILDRHKDKTYTIGVTTTPIEGEIMDCKKIGKQIQKCRESQGVKQEIFAEKVDLSPNYMSAIERGVKIPKLETFIRIANALNVHSDLLLSDVLKAGNEIKSTHLSNEISQLPPEEQQRIFNVIEVMIKNDKK